MAKAKPAAKAAPAPTVEEVVEVGAGTVISFLGYGEDVDEADQFLTAGEQYTVAAISEDGNPLVEIENPDFNPKKKVTDDNSKTVQVEVLPEEYEVVNGEEAAEEAPVEEAPAQKPAAKTAPAKKTAPAAKTAPAKKAAAAPAKKAAAKTPAAAPEEKEPVNETPDLDNEDADVLALIEGEGVDLVAVAQDLEHEAGSVEWKLGGVLYHIKKDAAHTKMLDEKGKRIKDYDGAGGFELFLQHNFNIEYRKATYLIKIYRDFTIAGITNPSEKLAAIGWTKGKVIAENLGKDGVADPEELIELAGETTVDELKSTIKEQIVEVGGTKTKGEKKKRVVLKFRLWEEEGATAKAVLEAVQEANGLKSLDEALSHIIGEYAAEHGLGGEATEEVAPKQTAGKPAARAAAKAPARRAAAQAAA